MEPIWSKWDSLWCKDYFQWRTIHDQTWERPSDERTRERGHKNCEGNRRGGHKRFASRRGCIIVFKNFIEGFNFIDGFIYCRKGAFLWAKTLTLMKRLGFLRCTGQPVLNWIGYMRMSAEHNPPQAAHLGFVSVHIFSKNDKYCAIVEVIESVCRHIWPCRWKMNIMSLNLVN